MNSTSAYESDQLNRLAIRQLCAGERFRPHDDTIDFRHGHGGLDVQSLQQIGHGPRHLVGSEPPLDAIDMK
jgi:hypothetical protein